MDKIKEIIEVILSEAKQEAAKILADADEEIAIENSKFQSELDSLQKLTEEQIEMDRISFEQRGKSMLESKLRELDLQKRQDIIETVINQAADRFTSLPDDEKIKLYRQMIQSAKIKTGEIRLNEKEQTLFPSLLAALGAGFSQGEIADIQGGLLIVDGRIEENASIDLILRDKRSDLASLVANLLF